MTKDIMVIDYNKCVRYARGDEYLSVTMVPFRCPECAKGVPMQSEDEKGRRIEGHVSYLTDATFSGRLARPNNPPVCADHHVPVVMERV